MTTFIKGGVWSKRKNIPKILNGELNLDELIAQQSVPGIQGPTGAQGVPGSQGIPGTAGAVGPAGLTWRSSWVSGTSYIANDAVGFGGASYFCILATSGTSNPSVATSNWALLASQGAQGVQGIQGLAGATGAQGNTGPAASQTLAQTIAVGNVVPFNTSWNTDGAYNIRINPDGIKFDTPFSTAFGVFSSGEMLYSNGTTYIAVKIPTTISPGNKTITFPDATGTVALQPTTSTQVVAALTATNFSGINYVRLFASSAGRSVKWNTTITIGMSIFVKNTSNYSIDFYANNLNIGELNDGYVTINPGEFYYFVKEDSSSNILTYFKLTNGSAREYSVNSSLTTAPNLTYMNAQYSNVFAYPIGSNIYFTSITAGALLYTKIATSTWVSSSITTVV